MEDEDKTQRKSNSLGEDVRRKSSGVSTGEAAGSEQRSSGKSSEQNKFEAEMGNKDHLQPGGAVEGASTRRSMFFASSNTLSTETETTAEEHDEESVVAETVVWEWEEELDAYDEPDVYPSEKDYIMVPVQVELTEEEVEEIERLEREAKREKERALSEVARGEQMRKIAEQEQERISEPDKVDDSDMADSVDNDREETIESEDRPSRKHDEDESNVQEEIEPPAGPHDAEDIQVKDEETREDTTEKDEKEEESPDKVGEREVEIEEDEGKLQSDEKKDDLEEKKDDVEEKKDDAEEKKDDAEEKKDDAEEKKDDAEEKKDDTEEKKDDAEEKKDDTEEKKDDAEEKKDDAEEKKDDAEEKKEDVEEKKDDIEEKDVQKVKEEEKVEGEGSGKREKETEDGEKLQADEKKDGVEEKEIKEIKGEEEKLGEDIKKTKETDQDTDVKKPSEEEAEGETKAQKEKEDKERIKDKEEEPEEEKDVTKAAVMEPSQKEEEQIVAISENVEAIAQDSDKEIGEEKEVKETVEDTITDESKLEEGMKTTPEIIDEENKQGEQIEEEIQRQEGSETNLDVDEEKIPPKEEEEDEQSKAAETDEVLTEMADGEKEEQQLNADEDKSQQEEEEKSQKEEEDKSQKEEEDKKAKEKKDERGASDAVSGGTTEDGIDPADEFEVLGLPEPEPEVVEPPPKRYKTVMVKTLVPRPPKIHYVPEEERKTHVTNDKHLFRKRPISLVMSYGYDCQRMANLHVLDRETLVFMSGFVLTFYNHKTKEQSYLRCVGGSCFGSLAIHPSRRLFAAAEKGDNPVVGIWSWPKLQLFRKLRDGTNKAYASVNFSPCGGYLATQGGGPDYLITVYNWLAEKPVVRVRSHAQDVYRVTFSKELAGRLTTSGLCHIKFWKMADTFTGLKLKGDIGRFGRTELSDIEGYIEMPDGKVLSGTEWGNLLLWENGLIVAEVCLKQNIPCHEGIVRQVLHVEQEFYTTGQDGWVRTWPFDAVDAAEISTTEDSLKVPVKSSGQVLIKENSDIWFIVQDIPDESSSSVFWFAQDGKGSIMRVDLSFLNTAKEPYPVLTAHGGPIVGCATSRINCIMSTLGADGQIRVYDYIRHKLLACRTFSAPGTTLLWPGTHFDESCCTMLVGFGDGTLRVVVLSGKKEADRPMSLVLHQVRKPHSRQITCIDIDSSVKYLATGSEDGTVFFFDINNDYMPLAFVDMPDYRPVISFKFIKQEYKESTEEEQPNKIIASIGGAILVEFLMPNFSDFDNTTSYQYLDSKFLRRLDFVSIKSILLHNEEIEMERLAEEQLNEALEAENRKKIEEGLETESQQNLRLLAEAEEMERVKAEMGPKKKWEPYIPPFKSPIALMIPSVIDRDEVFLSMSEYDTGYLYLMRFGEADKNNPLNENPQEPVRSIKFEDSKDTAVTAFTMTIEGDYIFLGFADGRIRVQNLEYPYALEHMEKHWTEGIHDCVRGQVTSICTDKDGVFVITTGQDGNCFLLSRLTDRDLESFLKRETLQPISEVNEREDVVDIIDPDFYTLEVFKRVEKEMALLAEAKRNKTAKREEIARLRIWYNDILRKNNDLPEEFRLTQVELALTKDKESRRKEEYEASLKQLKIETAWTTEKAKLSLEKVQNFYKDSVSFELFELKAFNSTTNVWSFRMLALPPWFDEAKENVETHFTPHSVDSGTIAEDISPTLSEFMEIEPKPKKTRGMDKFVYQRMVRIWERKKRKQVRAREWRDFLKTEPKSKDLKEEDKAIDEARANIGDMKLKSAADYKVPESKKLTEHRARKRLVQLEEKMRQYKKEFNCLLLELRKEKVKRLVRMNTYKEKIIECQKVLSKGDIKQIPEIKPMVISENPNRTMDYTVDDVKEYKRQIEEKLRAAAPVTKVVKKQEGPSVKRKNVGTGHQKQQTAPIKSAEKEDDSASTAPEKSRSLGSFVENTVPVLTLLEQRIKRTEIIKAKFWQDHHIQKIEEEKFNFDAKLKLLRHRKLKLDFLLKTADARMVLLTQEFILAQQSEALEASLEAKIHDTSKEKRECSNVIKTLSKKIEGVKKEIDTCARQKNALLNEVVALAVSRAPAFEKYLIRVFSKRMPKSKSRQNMANRQSSGFLDEDSDEDESSDSDDDDMDMDDDEDDGLDIDFPPPELNKDVYDSVVEIRGRRLKIDESEASVKEQLEDLNQMTNQYRQRVNVADREFERGRRELDSFRKEKQEKQNILNCAVTLKLHQIKNTDKDLSNALVTENRNIERLQQRIPELQKEKVKQKMMGMEMKKLNLQLHKEKVQHSERLQTLDKACDREMLVKFGQIRPVEELEFFGVDPKVAKIQNELKTLENQQHRELEQLDHEIGEALGAKTAETMRSISKLRTVAYCTETVRQLNKDMEEQMKRLPSELEDTLLAREIAFLKVVLTDQWNTISALSLEIAQLTHRRKTPLPPIKSQNPKQGPQ